MKPRLKPLQDQVVVITGASSGIGLATALAAARRGARVVLAARSTGTLDRVVAEITGDGGRVHSVTADVSDREQLERVADEAIGRFGRIDTWVNDAAVAIYGWLDEVSEEDSRRLFDINFWGVVNGSLVALLHLRHSSGAIINVGSEVSEAVVPLQGMYSASKHAVKGFTDALRVEVQEVRKLPVSISLIQPTAVDAHTMAAEPTLPTPQIDPERVAEAILKAAEHPTRDVRVGAMAALNTFLSRFAGRFGDKAAAKPANRQPLLEPPRSHGRELSE